LNTYKRKQQWKLLLLIAAILIGMTSLWYTNDLISKLSKEERKRVELWAEANRQLVNASLEQDIGFILSVIKTNETVPVMIVDKDNKIEDWRNLDTTKTKDTTYLRQQFLLMKRQHEPIEIYISPDYKNYIYYKDSNLLTQLYYYPFIQLGVIFLFIAVSYLAFSASRKAEQNQVWVGLSKETAHQLGTPISSLIAWIELLRLDPEHSKIIVEVEKDVKRLETITERFSKIGSAPVLTPVNIFEVITNAISYIKTRSSSKVIFDLNFPDIEKILVPMNVALFEWVVENLCKNAIDAMNGNGNIDITIIDHVQIIYLDIKDTGKGVPKSKYKTIFQPGYTTKKRGWGLGLSLSKRIIETYHNGKIFVKYSEAGKGTTFRIVLNK